MKGDVTMTTSDVASGTRGIRLATVAACCVIAALSLAACSAPNLLNDSANVPVGSLDSNNKAAPTNQRPVAQNQVKVAIAPLIGAPEQVATRMTAQLTSALMSRGIIVVKAGATSDYSLRGFVVVDRVPTGTKVIHLWDVYAGDLNVPKPQRVHRIKGEEAIPGAKSADAWASVTPAIIAQIVSKTSQEFGGWVRTRQPVSTTPVARTSDPGPAATPGTPRTPKRRTASVQKVSTTTTGSINPSGLLATPPRVSGAPGDGSKSLAAALNKQLSSQGVKFTSGPNPRAYNVNGRVVVGPANNGAQPIRIDWVVTDASGSNIGTVTQKNQIPAGSLDGAWGQTASVAAAAAAQGILKLMRQNTTPAVN